VPVSLSVDAEVEVPSPISLEVQMIGGDLTLEGVDGDKDLQVFAGDLKVDVGILEKIRSAKVSVSVGDVDVPAIGEVHGWLGHTWRFHGVSLPPGVGVEMLPDMRYSRRSPPISADTSAASIGSMPRQALAMLNFSPGDNHNSSPTQSNQCRSTFWDQSVLRWRAYAVG